MPKRKPKKLVKKCHQDSSEEEDEIKVEKVIAPIFAVAMKKKGEPKRQEDPEKVAARKAFLLSSVPDALLKKSQKDCDEENENWLTPFAPSSRFYLNSGNHFFGLNFAQFWPYLGFICFILATFWLHFGYIFITF